MSSVKDSSDNQVDKGRAISSPSIAMPAGGGAVRPLGGSFERDQFTGTCSYSIPIAVTPARGFEPQLMLRYDSSGGNGVWGVGFSMDVPSISVNTQQRIPQYNGTDQYISSEMQGLVPVASRQVQWQGQTYTVTTYLQRVQTANAQIERWQSQADGSAFWKVVTSDNITHTYGTSDQSRIANPAQPTQVAEWLLDETSDAKGNRIQYSYKAEDNVNVPPAIYEEARTITANRYLQSIRYGNYLDPQGAVQWAFQVVLNYGEYDLQNPAAAYQPARQWACRPDPFSSYRTGFEIRTLRRCQSILLFHLLPDQFQVPILVRSWQASYTASHAYGPVNLPTMSMLAAFTETGYRHTDHGVVSQSMPDLRLTFSQFEPPLTPEFKTLQLDRSTIPGYLDRAQYLPVDMEGLGLPGFLYADATTTLYMEPQGDGRYASPFPPAAFPIDRDLQQGDASLTDLDGNGQLQLVVETPNRAGYYQRGQDGAWTPFQPFPHYPNDLSDPRMEMANLSGNGKADAILTEQQQFRINYSEGKEGFAPATYMPHHVGYPLPFPDNPKAYVGFADIFGDGLSHRVRITPSSVEAWPSMGYGRFGDRVVLANPPSFSDRFDAQRLFLADIDGSGTTDLLYVHPDRIELYLNQSGNGFSDPITILLPEPYGKLDQIAFSDILGNGTNCLVFTKMSPSPIHYYYDFNGVTTLRDGTVLPSLKPYLLCELDNLMGAITQIQYCASTKFALQDKLAGRPWPTRLPFPVQVVEQVVALDAISRSRQVSKFRYHDGYYDPVERAFRGFGYVETWDSETFEQFQQSQTNPAFPVPWVNADLYAPPAYTRTWTLTGAFEAYDALMARYRQTWYAGDPQAMDFPGSIIDSDIPTHGPKTTREAYVALKGIVIRSEVYGQDGSPQQDIPYTVSQSNFEVVLDQPATPLQYAVFSVNPREDIQYQYERIADDPRITQTFVLAIDPVCGLPTQTCSAHLPRRKAPLSPSPAYPQQQHLRLTVTSQMYINAGPDAGYWFRGLPCEAQEFELGGFDIEPGEYYDYDSLKAQVLQALDHVIPYLTPFTDGSLQARQYSWLQTFYYNSQGVCGRLGEISAQGLVHHESTAKFSPDNITTLFGDLLTPEVIAEQGGYIYATDKGYWENCGLAQIYYTEPGMFYLLAATENVFTPPGSPVYSKTTLTYDPYALALVQETQYIDPTTSNVTSASIDYQNMQPYQVVDINGNVQQMLYDPLGQAVVSSRFGREAGQSMGAMLLYPYDGLPAEYVPRTGATFADVIARPEYYLQGAGTYTYYDLDAYQQSEGSQPASSIQLLAQNYYHLPGGATGEFKCQTLITYGDGWGREIEAKQAVEPAFPGPANPECVAATGLPVVPAPRWLVSGRTVYNNKGNPAEQYLPYFSETPDFQAQQAIVNEDFVVAPTVTRYDALDRVTRIDTPKGFFRMTTYGPWQQAEYDEDDTVPDSNYYQWFMANYPAEPSQAQIDEKNALEKAAVFANTPAIQTLDNMGRPFLTGQSLVATPGGQPGRMLTAGILTDIQGRVIASVDPRLLATNQQQGTDYANFRYAYPMDEDDPLYTDSADAGLQRQLSNIYGKLSWSFSPRNYCQLATYDCLQRQTTLLVRKIETLGPITGFDDFNLVEVYTYGESPTAPADANLRGQLYQRDDLSGTLRNPSYSIMGQVLSSTRQLVADYKTPVDWRNPVTMEPTIYPFQLTYDALGQTQTELTPDQTTTTYTYNEAGLLTAVGLTFSEGTTCTIVTDIGYNANRQRLSINYGNGIATTYCYEPTTLRLIQQSSTRPGAQPLYGQARWLKRTRPSLRKRLTNCLRYGILGMSRPTTAKEATAVEGSVQVQDISITYDPVGNVTRRRDLLAPTIIQANQQVEPLSDYTYDSLYRLLLANGRQHPGITATTYVNNAQDGSFKQSRFGQLPPVSDSEKLENYAETYSYDDSNNLIKLQHVAKSSSWTRDMPVEPDSNRLQGLSYDESGNLRQLVLNGPVNLDFNCCDNLVRTGIIQRPGELDDMDYYVYDADEQRTRKVCERFQQQGTLTAIQDHTYLGSYLVKQLSNLGSSGKRTTTLIRHTLRVMDGENCVAIVNHWEQDEKKRETDVEGSRQVRFQMDDALGSVGVEWNDAAQLISYEEYYPYGGTALIAGANQKEVELKDYRYAGKECDDSTGLYYFGQRYYVSWMGRWLNPDPAGPVDGLNLYIYVGNNPLSYSDPDGLMKRKRTEDEPPDWSRKKSRIIEDATQEDLDGSENEGRKSYYPTGDDVVDDSLRSSYVFSTSSVIAIMKVNGVELQAGRNGPADKKIIFAAVGSENRKGKKINFHAEDWSLNSFRKAYDDNPYTMPGFIDDLGAPPSSKNKGDAAGKPVFSLKINYSPCLGCVGTILAFKDFLESELGKGNYIFRVKFLRPYELKSNMKSDRGAIARSFFASIRLMERAGIKVRLQTPESARRMIDDPDDLDGDDLGRPVIQRLYPNTYKRITKTWSQLGVSRKSA